ncbi:hypothetical protein MY04_2983 [Flammeovirga sp. MY04]|uniref:hypothetical protein n=1 Tax=Flammeovirga sp. MY04 TaxID=1191459 RepID=UPI0008064191|nr:hypothetical protein [Flammeovirga sp. MY04]ANQ50351.1 hypothetical protein MY04_2983 [Flammeovirga sp. MY04]
MKNKIIAIALLIAGITITANADNPQKNIRKSYKTTTIAQQDTKLAVMHEEDVTAKKRKGAYHVQNQAGVNTLGEAQEVNPGKTIRQTETAKYPYMKWNK